MSMDVQIQKVWGAFHLDVAFKTDGGVLGLLGASGSGKSKTLQCIAGIERPDSGHVCVNGRMLFDSRRRMDMAVQDRRVGYLFQHYALFPNMTVAENIACGIRRGSVPSQEKRRIVQDMVDRLHLSGLERQKPEQLSGGQQQRVALARILVNEPDLLLLDEPFSALDSYLKEQVMAELRSVLKQFQKDVVIVTHSRDEAYQLCHTIAVLNQGKLEVMGPTEQVFSQPKTRAAAVLTGCRNIARACKRGRRRVYVPDWDVTLTVGHDVGDDLCAVGIRAHSFSDSLEENREAVQNIEILEQPFSNILVFRYARQHRGTEPLWWQRPKDCCPTAAYAGVAPSDILLLYPFQENCV